MRHDDGTTEMGIARVEPLHVFYDGECGLCSGFVAWALARDRDRLLRPEPAQSPKAREVLGPERARRSLEELHAWSARDGLLTGPVAVAAVLRRLPGWGSLATLIAAPVLRPLAMWGYAWVAARRRSFASRCPLPPGHGAQLDATSGERASRSATRSSR